MHGVHAYALLRLLVVKLAELGTQRVQLGLELVRAKVVHVQDHRELDLLCTAPVLEKRAFGGVSSPCTRLGTRAQGACPRYAQDLGLLAGVAAPEEPDKVDGQVRRQARNLGRLAVERRAAQDLRLLLDLLLERLAHALVEVVDIWEFKSAGSAAQPPCQEHPGWWVFVARASYPW